mmetsp:Transcript_33251/g.50149  ORF Transcript_33251/g.50149 Transcript_33251/m.50149 type:complete len:317 (+) Transcript_33251:61-1011(+)
MIVNMSKIIIDFPRGSFRQKVVATNARKGNPRSFFNSIFNQEDRRRRDIRQRTLSKVFSVRFPEKVEEEIIEKEIDPTEKSSARKFIDLTLGESASSTSRHESRHESISTLATAFTCDESLTGDDYVFDVDVDKMDLNDKPLDEEEEEIDYDDAATYTVDSWGLADAAFIQQVHEVSDNLEEELSSKGIESPYRKATDIFPSFSDLHYQIQSELRRQKRESKKNLTNDGDRSYGIRQSRRQSYFQRQFVGQFLYENRGDGSCSLPLVLAYGLEKRLSSLDAKRANEALKRLKSPLNGRRNFKREHKRKRENAWGEY